MLNKSEFATLSDLVIEKGYSHSELVSEIHDRVISEYKRNFSNGPQTVEVTIDEKTGKVSLMQDGNVVTPKEFENVADRIAREVLIEKLNDSNPKQEDNFEAKLISEQRVDFDKKKKKEGFGKWIMMAVFWGYNAIYLFVIAIFLINFLTNQNLRESFFSEFSGEGIVRITFLMLAFSVPLFSVATAYRLMKKKIYNNFGRLFFLFEVPLVALSLVFSNVLSNSTPSTWFLFIIVVFSIPVTLSSIIKQKTDSKRISGIFLFLRESLFLFSTYAVVMFSFVTPLVLGYIARIVFDFVSENILSIGVSYYRSMDPFEMLLTIVVGGFYILITLALTSVPYLFCLYMGRTFLKSQKEFSEVYGADLAKKLMLIFAGVWIVMFAFISYQPRTDKLIDKLESVKESNSFDDREIIAKELIPQKEKIQKAFDDLKNVRNRYLMAKDDDYIKDAYVEILETSDFVGDLVQSMFMTVAYPFVYHGSLDRSNVAYENYSYIFGEYYYGSTNYYRNPSRSIGTQNVTLVSRKIDATTDYDGAVATVTIDEQYSTTNNQDQEVIYEFYLPEDAVVTDLKLGPELEFQGIVAPRGAASQTYQQQIVRRKDPALLEQTGPNQYRLRVYPVPGKSNRVLLQGKNQRIAFTYIASSDETGYQLPTYTKEQNISVNQKYVSVKLNGDETQISNNHVISKTANKNGICDDNSKNLRTDFSLAKMTLVPNSEIKGNSCMEGKINLLPLINGKKIAFLFDVSYTEEHPSDRADLFNMLKDGEKFLENNEVTYYKFNDLSTDAKRLTKEEIDSVFDFTYFGTPNLSSVLESMDESYDFILILSNSDEKLTNSTGLDREYPVYIIHEKGLPPYLTNATSAVLQSGGGVYDNVRDAVNTAVLGIVKPDYNDKQLISAGPFYSFYSDNSRNQVYGFNNWYEISANASDSAMMIFSKKYLEEILANQNTNVDASIYYKDLINTYSVANNIVSPYSSMVALVNEQQIQTLENLSQNYDRYDESSTITNPRPVTLNAPSFESLERGSIVDMFGVSQKSGPTSSTFGGGGLYGAPSAPSGFGVGDAVVLNAPSGFDNLENITAGKLAIPAFLLLNAVIIGFGIVFFGFSKIRNWSKKRKIK